MAGKTHCLACGHPLDRKTPRCPQCGVAQPVRPVGGFIALALLLGGLCIVTVVAILRN
ncbi:hypothetical protein ACROSR_02880 [Roseovarius tibetensis]|uniref:hypothetical protein n=1 Tax=Roseovarius tibetensis TaxID=2685897 RepID=UPI003D7F4C80